MVVAHCHTCNIDYPIQLILSSDNSITPRLAILKECGLVCNSYIYIPKCPQDCIISNHRFSLHEVYEICSDD